jgi:uncharacterized membrane protein YdbT with pleckstrin-like domain
MPEIIDRFRSSTWGWLRGTFAGWGTLALLLIGAGSTGYFLATGTLQDRAWIGPVLLVAGIGITLWKWIVNLATTYEVSADRLILHKGILMKSIDEIELYRVKDVRIDFSLINQTADIGTITITSSDETTRDAPLTIRDVDRARARRERLRELVDAARRTRGVREVDMVHEHPGEPV